MYLSTPADHKQYLIHVWSRDIASVHTRLPNSVAVGLLREGSPEARTRLLYAYLPVAFTISTRWRDTEEAISVLNLALWESVLAEADHCYSERGSLINYISAILINALRNERRHQNRIVVRRSVSLDAPTSTTELDGATYADVIPADTETPEEIVARHESHEYLRALLQKHLTRKQYPVMLRKVGLHGGDPMPEREIAAELGCSWLKVKKLALRAVDRLRAVPNLHDTLQALARPTRITGRHLRPLPASRIPPGVPRHQYGGGCYTQKLDADKVRDIRASLKAGVSGRELEKRYGVSNSAISNIKHRRTWKDVK